MQGRSAAKSPCHQGTLEPGLYPGKTSGGVIGARRDGKTNKNGEAGVARGIAQEKKHCGKTES